MRNEFSKRTKLDGWQRAQGRCAIEGCRKPQWARGWCAMHYRRWYKNGSPENVHHKRFSPAEIKAFLQSAISYRGDECLLWPFSRNADGYGTLKGYGKSDLVHRLVCEAICGPAPPLKTDAAHSCGNGHLGCVNPSHLRWATRSENVQDALLHGRRFLSPSVIFTIRRRLSNGDSARAIAADLNITPGHVRKIRSGKSWPQRVNEVDLDARS